MNVCPVSGSRSPSTRTIPPNVGDTWRRRSSCIRSPAAATASLSAACLQCSIADRNARKGSIRAASTSASSTRRNSSWFVSRAETSAFVAPTEISPFRRRRGSPASHEAPGRSAPAVPLPPGSPRAGASATTSRTGSRHARTTASGRSRRPGGLVRPRSSGSPARARRRRPRSPRPGRTADPRNAVRRARTPMCSCDDRIEPTIRAR